jgi:hypothetical protein
MSLDPNSGGPDWKRQLVEAEAHANALMSASLTHSIECPGPDPGKGIELLKSEQTKSQAMDASEQKEPPALPACVLREEKDKSEQKDQSRGQTFRPLW